MRKLSVLGAVIALTLSIAVQAGAATPGALKPGAGVGELRRLLRGGPRDQNRSRPVSGTCARIEAGAASNALATGAGVKVGVIDGGVDFTHPDLAGSLDVGRSCSFIFTDTPTADPAEIANGDCTDKAAVQDLEGHGTHVATTIAGRINGVGIAGVAPHATIVALKACTIAGFCFADSVAAALRYAGDQRLDVVNLSLFADPFLYFCRSEAEQRAILKDLQAAARYAQQRGVVIVAAAGNEAPGPRPPHDRRHQPRLAAGHRHRAGGAANNCPRRPGRAARCDHRVGQRRLGTGRLLEHGWAGRRRDRTRW